MRARIALAGLATVVAAWFGVLLVDTHRVDQAAASKGTIAAVAAALKGPQAEFDRRIDLLRQARFLNPDTTVDLDIAGAHQVRGGAANLNRALRTVESVLGSEPQNLDAWAALYSIQQSRHDLAGERVALAHARRLDPLGFPTS
jgi:hypothetical protein